MGQVSWERQRIIFFCGKKKLHKKLWPQNETLLFWLPAEKKYLLSLLCGQPGIHVVNVCKEERKKGGLVDSPFTCKVIKTNFNHRRKKKNVLCFTQLQNPRLFVCPCMKFLPAISFSIYWGDNCGWMEKEGGWWVMFVPPLAAFIPWTPVLTLKMCVLAFLLPLPSSLMIWYCK